MGPIDSGTRGAIRVGVSSQLQPPDIDVAQIKNAEHAPQWYVLDGLNESQPALPDVSHAIVKISQGQTNVLLVILPGGQVCTLKVVEGFPSHIALRL